MAEVVKIYIEKL